MAYLPEDTNDWPSSVLTRRQRERLREGFDPDREADDTMKARIRTRAQAGLLDFALLLDELPRDETKKVFREPDPAEQPYSPIASSIPSVLGFLYLAGLNREFTSPTESEGWYFADSIEVGIQHALNSIGVQAENVSVDIDIERGPSFEQYADRPLADLPRYSLSQMLTAGVITGEEYADALGQKR